MNKLWEALDVQKRALLEAHAEPVVAVRPKVVRALKGNGNAAILLCQFLYWTARSSDQAGWFYNSQEELEQQTGLGADGQLSARKVLLRRGLLEEKRRAAGASLSFRLNLEAVYSLLVDTAVDNSESGLVPNLNSVQAPILNSVQARQTESVQAPIYINKDYKDYTETPQRLTQTQDAPSASVAVGSQFSLDQCQQYARHLHETGQGINNPGGFAVKIHRTGEVDAQIERFLGTPPEIVLKEPESNCKLCLGTGKEHVFDATGKILGVKPLPCACRKRPDEGIQQATVLPMPRGRGPLTMGVR